jgi:hypothetical protein
MPAEQIQRAQEDAENLWREVGLEELRQALREVEALTRCFEASLHALPPCAACARVSILQQIHADGSRLGSKVVSLTVLASTLKQAVAVAEQAQTELAANVPAPCQCSSGPCTCHDSSGGHR